MEKSLQETKHWYDTTWKVVILCLLFFPVGLYGLWKSDNIKKGWKIAWTIIIAFSVFRVFSNPVDKSTTGSATESVASVSTPSADGNVNTAATYAKIGDEVDIENFTYRVNRTYFTKKLGNEFSRQTADGIYLIIDLSLKNKDTEEHTVDNSLFKLTDEKGTEYESSTDGNTALEMSGKKTLFLKQCNPNIQKQGLLCFEVPEKKVYDLHLSGGFWSGKTAVVKLTDQ